MALLQNKSDNILPVDSNQMEGMDNMENAKKVVETDEAKGDTMEITDASAEVVENQEESSETAEENVETDAKVSVTSKASPEKPKEQSADEKMPQETPSKRDNEVEAADEEVEDEEEEDGEHEEKKGLFDLPLEVEGKRERHKVERITVATPTPKKPATAVRMGDGVPLGEIAYIEDQLQKHRAEELKTMHRVLYGSPGKTTTLKKEIRKFTGFGFEEDSQEFKKKVAFLNKLTKDQLVTIKNVLGLHSGGQSKDAVVTTIMLFLMKTVDHARRVSGSKKRKSSVKMPTSAKRPRKAKSEEEVVSDDDEDEVEEEEKTAAKTTAKTPVKATAKASTKATKTPTKTPAKTPKKASSTKTPMKKKEPSTAKKSASKADSGSDISESKKKPKRRSEKDSDEDTSSSSSVDTHEENNPSDKDLETVIEELLSQVDLSQVSMKQMCQAVIEKFPGTNIATRVDYLKGKIKQSLSTK